MDASVSSFREGDFVESTEGLIFDVKGLVHPPDRVIAFIRYIPNSRGDRERRGVRYRKIYELSERYNFLRKNYPHYLCYNDVFGECLNEVPLRDVVYHYKPQQKTLQLLSNSNLDSVEKQTLAFIRLLNELTHIPLSSIGVSGSVLVGLHTKNSDIDLIVYGADVCHTLKNALKKLLQEGGEVKPLTPDLLRGRYFSRQRDTPVSYEEYLFHESRKSFQGFFKDREFFIRYVKDWSEVEERYGDVFYENAGYAEVKGVIANDKSNFFTPCTYGLAGVEVINGKAVSPITEISSFRGRYCEQAFIGELVMARGKLEKVTKKGQVHYRLLLGNNKRDYMKSLNRSRDHEGESR